jgi:hypothetical protein
MMPPTSSMLPTSLEPRSRLEARSRRNTTKDMCSLRDGGRKEEISMNDMMHYPRNRANWDKGEPILIHA